jgi:ubiquinone/menaquinone biosynthesis C-methylase UbiE
LCMAAYGAGLFFLSGLRSTLYRDGFANMETQHSVSSHLRLDTAEYDRIIRTYIPYYDESRDVQLDFLAAANLPGAAQIVDLGGGTGSLAEAILERFPHASVLVRDIDPEMLEVARTRLARFASRVELSVGSFADPLPPADAVLSAFALHHIPSLREKTEVYRRIRQAIRPGGVFLNNDAVSGPFWPLLRDQWAGFMASRGFTLEQGYRNLDDWAAEDTYFSVYEELEAMAQAGLERPECLWRRGPVNILGALL